MPALRHFAVATALLFALSLSASAEEGILSRLNPFGSSSKPTSSAQNKPFPGTRSRKKPEKSMIGKSVDAVTSTTKTAWNKTTSALNPMNLMPGSSKSDKNTRSKSTSSWPKSENDPGKARTASDWIGQPRIEP